MTKFETGRIYYHTRLTNNEQVLVWKVMRRTRATVWLVRPTVDAEPREFRVRTIGGVETIRADERVLFASRGLT